MAKTPSIYWDDDRIERSRRWPKPLRFTGTTTESREAGDGVSSILRTEDGKSSDAFTEPLFNELLDSGLSADLPEEGRILWLNKSVYRIRFMH